MYDVLEPSPQDDLFFMVKRSSVLTITQVSCAHKRLSLLRSEHLKIEIADYDRMPSEVFIALE